MIRFFLLYLFVLSLAVITPAAEKPTEVKNQEPGLWDKEGGKSFRLIKDLVIGKEQGEDYEVLGRIMGVAVDSQDNIYILDRGFERIRKYNRSGLYLRDIGGKGEGPGEFLSPTAITVDSNDFLYLADQTTVKIYDPHGEYIDEFKHVVRSFYIRSIKTNPATGQLYIISFDISNKKIIHAYDSNYQFQFSFCDSYAAGRDEDPRIESVHAGGKIDIDHNGLIYYTQMTPYEIRIFSPLGELLTRIHRENTFMQPPKVERTDNSMRFTMPTASASIVLLQNNMFLNVVIKPPVPNPPKETIIDLFDESGRLLTTKRFEESMNILCTDQDGLLYGTNSTDYPTVVRYRLVFD